MRTNVVLGCCYLFVGCMPAFTMRVPRANVRPGRLVALPVTTVAYELDFSGKIEERVDLATRMATSIDAELERYMSAIGADNAVPNDVRATGISLDRFEEWAEVAMREIAARKMAINTREKRNSVDQWRCPYNLESWRGALNADFVLTSFFRDTRETAANQILGAFAGVTTYYKQLGVVCVVDLRDGRMVWCNAKSDGWADLQDPYVAAKAIWELLNAIFPAPQLAVKSPPVSPTLRPSASSPD